AEQKRLRLLEIYPELEQYLAEDCHAVVARNLRSDISAVRRHLGDIHLSCVRKILTGNPKRNDGEPYSSRFVDKIWTALAQINQDPALVDQLRDREPSKELAHKVCHCGVPTLTGRIRGRVTYCQVRNTPFQGLAADGAALALFSLVKEGFRVVAFIHDEVL